MAKLTILDHTGHSEMKFDAATKSGISEAMQKFEQLVGGSGHTAAGLYADGRKEIIRNFDPNAQEIILMPRLKGG